jgi:hypothetical protein
MGLRHAQVLFPQAKTGESCVIKAEPRFDESEACACGSMHAFNSPDSPRRNTYLALELWDKSQENYIIEGVFTHPGSKGEMTS